MLKTWLVALPPTLVGPWGLGCVVCAIAVATHGSDLGLAIVARTSADFIFLDTIIIPNISEGLARFGYLLYVVRSAWFTIRPISSSVWGYVFSL